MTLCSKTTFTLGITEVFLSMQGESSLVGFPTTFIRLAGCNLRCRWCDTPYSFPRGEIMTVDGLIEMVQDKGARYVCITGGEPLLQAHVHPLMTRLCDLGYEVSLETGGSLPIDLVDPRVKIILDVKCPASGMSDRNEWANLEAIRCEDEVKFVIADREDFEFAMGVCAQYTLFDKTENVLFSPVFGEMDSRRLVEWILAEKLPVRLNLQVHKFVWSPDAKGV